MVGIGSLGLMVEKSTKNQIIQILSDTWPLSSKEIHNQLIKNSSSGSSYQATHKLLTQLVSDSILEKNDMKYLLNKDWINNINNFGKSLHSRYFDEKRIPIEELVKQNSFNIKFSNPMKMGRFLVEFMNESQKYSLDPIVFKWYHAWPLVGFSDDEMKVMSKIYTSAPVYIGSKNFTSIDNITLDLLKKYGAKIVEQDLPFDPDTMVIGDFVMHFYFGKIAKKIWSQMCKRIKNGNEFQLLKQLFVISEENFMPVNVIANKAPELAKEIRKEFEVKK